MARKRAEPPSGAVRRIAQLSVPIAVVAGLFALSGVVALVVNLAVGAGAWSVVSSVAMVGFWAPIAYGVGIELRRSVREWDLALAGQHIQGDRR